MNYVATIPGRITPINFLPRHLLQDELGQTFLRDARRIGLDVRCACRPALSSPLVVHVGTTHKLHLQSRINTSHEHSTRCPHGNASLLAASYGLPSGSLSSAGGQLVIDLHAMFPTSPLTSATGVGGKFTPPYHGKVMYSLGMLLLEEAGLLTLHSRESQLDSWRRMQAAARSISVKNVPGDWSLENFLLVPSAAYKQQRATNLAKLFRACEVTRKGGRLLFATVLPSSAELRTPGSEMSLEGSHNVFLTIRSRVLARAWSTFTHAEAHHRLGRPVLALGMATVNRGKAGIKTRATQLALIPVGELLTPTPTPNHWQALQGSAARGDSYGVQLDEDPVFRLCCSV